MNRKAVGMEPLESGGHDRQIGDPRYLVHVADDGLVPMRTSGGSG